MSERATELHHSKWQGVFYLTGGGAGFLAETLNTPGASATVLEASVPYANKALSELLGRTPDQAASAATARQMAMAAYERAQHLGSTQAFGFGSTAALATNREKKGAHRAHWAIQTDSDTFTFSATYSSDRSAEELQLTEQLWQTLRHCLITRNQPIGETLLEIHARANPQLKPLLRDTPYRFSFADNPSELLLPGSFNPLHDGHKEMLALAEGITGLPGAFELAVKNADKPSLDFLTIEERVAGMLDEPLWLTNTPTFAGKAKLFPNATFVVGVDTLARIGELRFYQNHVDLLDQAMATFHNQNVYFVVFGRLMGERFITLEDLDVPRELRERCTQVSETSYRNDTSSTEIRQQLTVTPSPQDV